MADQRIVVYDPTHELNEGTVVDGPARVSKLERARVVLMPFDDPRGKLGAVDGYFKRGWGKGWRFDRMAGERGCPMLMYVEPSVPYVYWAARLVAGEKNPSGQLKLTTDSSGQRAMSGGLSADVRCAQLGLLGKPDADGGWTVGGRSRLTTASSGLMALCLYGIARDAVVVWSAVTLAVREMDLPWFVE